MARKTIKEIAQECGVSLSTVSLVLNNNPRISEETRKRVLAAVAKYEYQPNAFARSLASKSSSALSVVVPHLNHVFADVYFGEIVSGIYERATDLGYKVLLDMANHKFVNSQEYIRLLQSRRVDGMLFIGSSIHDKYLLEFGYNPYAFILVNHFFPQSKINCIMADYAESGRIAAQHLIDFGHRHIGLITGTNTHTSREFHTNFVSTLEKAGVGKEDVPWADGWFTEQGGYEAAEWLMDRFPKLTALMAANDKMAVGAIRQLVHRGLRVPQDVSVMGMDDTPNARFMTPGLTTIRHDLYKIGSQAVDGLLAVFRKEVDSYRQVLPVELIVRESTGPVAKRS